MKRLVLLALAAALPASSALANPIAVDVLRVRQVPSTRHVQLTFGHDSSVGEAMPTPGVVKRDGVVIDVTWVDMDTGYTANTGSGLTSVDATQFCDCDVDPGAHTYSVAIDGQSWDLSGSVTVTEAAFVPRQEDAGSTDDDADVYPWEIPEPTAIQGLDCNVRCQGTVAEPIAEEEPDVISGEDTATTSDTGATSDTGIPGSTDTDTNLNGGGGCDAGGGPVALLLALGALLALALLRRRRA